jgi:hypothetical protein
MIEKNGQEVDGAPKRPGRPRKTPFVSILSPEVIEGLLTPAQIAERERKDKDSARKRQERLEKKLVSELDTIETKEELWSRNRKLLAPEELDALLARQERMFDQVHWANDAMGGTLPPPDDVDYYVSVEEGAADLFEFVEAHGTVTMELVLLGTYWQTPLYQESFNGSDNNSIFARLGLVVGFPDHKLHEFQQWLAARNATPAATAPSNGFTTLTCAIPGCTSLPTAVHNKIAAGYRERGIPYRCHNCIRAEHASRNKSTIVQDGRHILYGGAR